METNLLSALLAKRKIVLIIIGVILIAVALIYALFGLKEIKPEQISVGGQNGQAIPVDIPNLPPPPVVLMSGQTSATVKEIKTAAKEIIAEVALPQFLAPGQKPPERPEQFERRDLVLQIAENIVVQSIASNSTDKELKWVVAALADLKVGDKISFEYKGDILNPKTQSLAVTSIKIYRIIKK